MNKLEMLYLKRDILQIILDDINHTILSASIHGNNVCKEQGDIIFKELEKIRTQIQILEEVKNNGNI